jgi:dihydrofolate reductase
MRLTVHEFLTIDGVVQGPGGVDEDPSGGFELGGWIVPFVDEDFGEIVDGWFGKVDEFLLGRNTYDMFFAYWSEITDPENNVATKLNTLPKHVASRTVTELAWKDATVLDGDVIERVRELKARPGGELQVHGSCGLARDLHAAGLVDEYRLITFPLVLGTGKRLFTEGAPPSGFTVVDSRTTAAGATYVALAPAPLDTSKTFVTKDGRESVA